MIHPYGQPCPRKKPTYRYERTGADRLRFTARWKRKSLQVRDDAHWMCEVCRDKGKVTTDGLEVHHIEKLRDDPDGLIEDDNLVCLCRMHHRMADDGDIDKDYLRGLALARIGEATR
jgi:hypothetical protein